MTLADDGRGPGRATRILLAVPFFGRILRETLYGDADNIYYLLAAVLSLWAIAVMTWGLPALVLPALAMVPAIWIVLLLITIGR